MFVVFVTQGPGPFKGSANNLLHFIKEGGAEGISEESVIKVAYIFPETGTAESAFGNKTVDMGAISDPGQMYGGLK